MRALPAAMSEALAAGATTFAHVWRVTRRDGAVFGFTDHDSALVFDGLACTPTEGLRVAAIEKSMGLNVDSASFTGALSAAALSEVDLARGVWDCARVDLYRVDWRDPAARVHLFAGRVGEVRRGAAAFEAELRGLQAPLNVAVGRVFSRFCDADLGDARCGKTLTSDAYRAAGAVGAVLDPKRFSTDDLSAYASGWFTRGRVVWNTGGESEIAGHSRSGGVAFVELVEAPANALTPGSPFTIFAGCDKRAETCRTKFANIANFRGFPHMPGNDAVQAQPAEGELHDGGSRWR